MAKSTWKLVRDNIPAIIEADGRIPETRIVTGNKYIISLKKKLDEEVKELKQVVTEHHNEHTDYDRKVEITEELSDVLEVLAAISFASGIDTEQLFRVAQAKREERGAFLDGIELKITK